MNDKVEQLKAEINRLKELHLKPINSNNDFNYLSMPLEKTKQVQKITEGLSEYLDSLSNDNIDKKTQTVIEKIIDSEVSNLMNSIYS
ncbi:hypothetical protein [Winogradskyella rapida]|uniref:Uncharacterized protein n=1 Tax=Winogradskyella rapida TaxID=549701 RepID=A0ABW3KMI7_9FLAO